MIITRRGVLAGLGGVVGTILISPPGRSQDRFAAIDALLAKDPEDLGGGCALVLYQGTKVVYEKGFGIAEPSRLRRASNPSPLGPWTPRTVVPIASASKWLSAGVIMALTDKGVFSLDDPVSRYLPSFSGEKASLTLRQCFSHTHGFAEEPHYHRDTSLTMAEAADRIAKLDLMFQPGTKLYYSGLGMQVAGRVAEVTTGKPWVDIFREQIGDPLTMTRTDYYAFGVTKNPNVAGSVRTSAEEYARFTAMVLNKGVYAGKRVLSEAAVVTMTSNQSGNVQILRQPWSVYAQFFDDPRVGTLSNAPSGIGVWLERVDTSGLGIEMSTGGAFGCQPFVYRDLNVAGCFMPYRLPKRGPNPASVRYLRLKRLIIDLFG